MSETQLLKVPNGMGEVRSTFGNFKFVELSGGNVDIDDTWERDNLVTLRNVCGTKFSVRMHRLVAPIFEQCLKEAIEVCPDYKLKLMGSFCPRHKMHDPKRELSTHSWGIAFDINWDQNPVSSKLITDIPSAFVKVFTDRGWDWGGNWRGTKDSMHFQFAKGC